MLHFICNHNASFHTQNVKDNVIREFPIANATSNAKAQSLAYLLVQTAEPQLTANAPSTSSAKSSAKSKKKKSPLDDLSKMLFMPS